MPAGSLILSTRAPIGYLAETLCEMAFNQGCRGLVPTVSMDIRYFRYQLSALRDVLQSRGAGSTFQELSTADLATMTLTNPSVEAQRAIADFLDAETARIDALIAKKRRMYSAIEERFQSERDRQVRHLMAEHDSTVVRRLVDGAEQGWSPSCEDRTADASEWGVLKTSAVTEGTFNGAENKRLPDDLQPDLRWVVEDGDLLVARGSGSIKRVGTAAVVATEGRNLLISDLIYRLVRPRMDPALLAHCINSSVGRTHLESSIRSDVGQTLKIRGDDLLNTPVPSVPPRLQAEVLGTIERRVYLVRKTIERLSVQLALLAEHRQALITAAVTGRIEVPGAVAS